MRVSLEVIAWQLKRKSLSVKTEVHAVEEVVVVVNLVEEMAVVVAAKWIGGEVVVEGGQPINLQI